MPVSVDHRMIEPIAQRPHLGNLIGVHL